MIQLDGLYNPYTKSGYVHDQSDLLFQKEVNEVIYERLDGQLQNNKNLCFLVTMTDYSPPGEVGGILFTDKDRQHTIQEFLIKEGLARVDRDEAKHRIPAKYKNLWIRLEEEAKKNSKGFWKTHPEIMKRAWDDEKQ